MRYLDDLDVKSLGLEPYDDVALPDAIDIINRKLASMGGKARVASIPVGRRTVFGEYRDDATHREELTLLIVADETRPLARAELFIHTRRIAKGETDSAEMLSRLDERRPGQLPIDDGYPEDENN